MRNTTAWRRNELIKQLLKGRDTLKLWDEILEKYDGNTSILWQHIATNIDLTKYRDYDCPDWFPEFCCFESDYARYIKALLEKNLMPKTIIDVGCQYGFQAELFRGICTYIGIEKDPSLPKYQPNQTESSIIYLDANFVDLHIDLTGATVISNMSIGFFGGVDENVRAIEKLCKCKTLCVSSSADSIEILRHHFDHVEVLFLNSLHPKYIMWKD